MKQNPSKDVLDLYPLFGNLVGLLLPDSKEASERFKDVVYIDENIFLKMNVERSLESVPALCFRMRSLNLRKMRRVFSDQTVVLQCALLKMLFDQLKLEHPTGKILLHKHQTTRSLSNKTRNLLSQVAEIC
jgi:hypothetical protein